jgi:hypothetical protein
MKRLILILAMFLFAIVPSFAMDHGQFDNSIQGTQFQTPEEMHAWFNKLQSGKGLCCSFADGMSIKDVDWDTKDGNYRVKIDDQWIVVPDSAVIKEPNKFGPAVVWPYKDATGATQIRCFIPGSGT